MAPRSAPRPASAPDPDTAAQPTARVGVLTGYRRVVTRLGGDPAALLARRGLPPDALDDPDVWMPYAVLVDLLEDAARALGRPDFGLELAEHQGLLAALGPAALIARHAEDVASTLGALGSWMTIAQTRAVFFDVDRLPSGDGRLRWRLRLPRRADSPQVNELNHAICLRVLESLRGRSFRPREVRFVHAAPADRTRLHAVFGERLRFRAEHNEIRIAAADMDARNPHSDAAMRELARGYVQRLGRRHGGPPDTVGRCADLIAQLLSTRNCTLESVAEDLDLHPRTLQRRLAEAGTDFRTLLERERRTFAVQYLADPELPLVRVATRLGYADQPTFTRAFRGWFGETPAAMRRRLQADGDDAASA
jgi:AraC-like DNA-binding protein